MTGSPYIAVFTAVLTSCGALASQAHAQTLPALVRPRAGGSIQGFQRLRRTQAGRGWLPVKLGGLEGRLSRASSFGGNREIIEGQDIKRVVTWIRLPPCRRAGENRPQSRRGRWNEPRRPPRAGSGVARLRLAKDAHRIFEAKGPDEKRTLLNLVLSNCSWANSELSTEFRQPFDLLKETNLSPDTKNPAKRPDFSQNQRWLRG